MPGSQCSLISLVTSIIILPPCRDALLGSRDSSKKDFADSVCMIVKESEKVEDIARKVALACSEQALQKVSILSDLTL